MTKRETPGVETIGAGGGPRADPTISCHTDGCGAKKSFMAMKRDPEWHLEYTGNGLEWVAFCPDCDDEWGQ